MKNNDAHINFPWQDVLERAGFAEAIANGIMELEVSEGSFVIGITGAWGAGKSSISSLVSYYIKREEIKKADINGRLIGAPIRNYDYSELDQLAEKWSDRQYDVRYLRYHLEPMKYGPPRWLRCSCGNDEHAADIFQYCLLKDYVERNPSIVIVPFSSWMISGTSDLTSAFLSEIGVAINQCIGGSVEKSFREYTKRLAELMPLVGSAIDVNTGAGIGSVVKKTSRWFLEYIDRVYFEDETLYQIRKKLKKNLTRLDDQKILVVLDDLDRLTPKEALKLVSLVKSVGDLPNIVYLLNYDENNLIKLLHSEFGNEEVFARAFLEKIIQYKREIPLFEEDISKHYLEEKLEKLIIDYSESDEIGFVLEKIVTYYVNNPRDVNRLANNFQFALQSMKGCVNQTDLLIIETLFLFEPKAYQIIRNRGCFRNLFYEEYEDYQKRLFSLLETDIVEENRETVKCALAILIDDFRLATEPLVRNEDYTRLSNDASFLNYFRLHPKGGTLNKIYFLDLLSNESPRQVLDTLLSDSKKISNEKDQGTFRARFLTELRIRFKQSYIKMDGQWFNSLMSSSIEFINYEDVQDSGLRDNFKKLVAVFIEGLQCMNAAKQVALLKKVLQGKFPDYSLLCCVLRNLLLNNSNSQNGEFRSLLKQFSAYEIELLMKSEELWKQKRPAELLFLLAEFDDEKVYDFTSSLLQSSQYITQLFDFAINGAVFLYAGEEGKQPRTYIQMSHKSRILDLQVLKTAADVIVMDEVESDERKLMAQKFIEAFHEGQRIEANVLP